MLKIIYRYPSSIRVLFILVVILFSRLTFVPFILGLESCSHYLFLHTVSYAFFTSMRKEYVGRLPSVDLGGFCQSKFFIFAPPIILKACSAVTYLTVIFQYA